MKEERRFAGAAVIALLSIDTIEVAVLSGKLMPASGGCVDSREMIQDKVGVEGMAMENQGTNRLEEGKIGIVDAIRFTVTQLLAFFMDSEEPVTLKD